MKLNWILAAGTLFCLNAHGVMSKATITFNRDIETHEYFREGRKYAFNDNQLFRKTAGDSTDDDIHCRLSVIAEKSGTKILKGAILSFDRETARPYLDRLDADDRTLIPSYGGGFGISLSERYDSSVGIAGRMNVLNRDGENEEQDVIVTAFCSTITQIPTIGKYWLPSRKTMITRLKPYFSYTETQEGK